MKDILLLTVVFSFCALAERNFEPTYSDDLPNKATDITYDNNGHLLRLTSSSWVDRVKTPKGQKYHKFSQGYDYKKKQGFIKVFDENGKLIHERWNKNIVGGVAREELLNAFKLFKNNKIIINRFNETEKQIKIFGGFNFTDNIECQLGNRCVHVMASTSDNPMIAHAIVRLSDAQVIYPDYDMDKSKWKKLHKNTKPSKENQK